MIQVSDVYVDKLRGMRDKAYEIADKSKTNGNMESYFKFLGMAEAYDDAFSLFRDYEIVEQKPTYDPYNSDKYRDDEVQQRVMGEEE